MRTRLTLCLLGALALGLAPPVAASTSSADLVSADVHAAGAVLQAPAAVTSLGIVTAVRVPSDSRASTPVYDRPASITGVSAPAQRPQARPPIVAFPASGRTA